MDIMDDFNKDPVGFLQHQLQTTATLKKNIWKLTMEMFVHMKKETSGLVNEILLKSKDFPDIEIEYKEVDALEFNLKFGSDVLIFELQTNIVTFNATHPLMKTKYLQENRELRYFAQVMIYDFLSDSIKYNRTEDSGYLLARVLVNAENHFMVEGPRGLYYLFNGIEHTEATCENLSLLVKKTMAVAIDSDLFGPDFKQIQYITFGQKKAKNKEIGHGQKIGFQMKNDADIEG